MTYWDVIILKLWINKYAWYDEKRVVCLFIYSSIYIYIYIYCFVLFCVLTIFFVWVAVSVINVQFKWNNFDYLIIDFFKFQFRNNCLYTFLYIYFFFFCFFLGGLFFFFCFLFCFFSFVFFWGEGVLFLFFREILSLFSLIEKIYHSGSIKLNENIQIASLISILNNSSYRIYYRNNVNKTHKRTLLTATIKATI